MQSVQTPTIHDDVLGQATHPQGSDCHCPMVVEESSSSPVWEGDITDIVFGHSDEIVAKFTKEELVFMLLEQQQESRIHRDSYNELVQENADATAHRERLRAQTGSVSREVMEEKVRWSDERRVAMYQQVTASAARFEAQEAEIADLQELYGEKEEECESLTEQLAEAQATDTLPPVMGIPTGEDPDNMDSIREIYGQLLHARESIDEKIDGVYPSSRTLDELALLIGQEMNVMYQTIVAIPGFWRAPLPTDKF